MIRLAGLLLATTLLTMPFAASAETVRIAVEDDWAPFASIKADRSGAEGFAVDVVRESFKTQGIDVDLVVVPFSRCLHYAEIGTTVGCFNTTRNEGNEHIYHWHPTPLLVDGLSVFANIASTDSDVTEKDLEGRTVGYTLGYAYPVSIMENPAIKRFGVQSDDQLIHMAAAGRVDFVLLNDVAGFYKMSRMPEVKGKVKKVGVIARGGFWIAFSKKHADGERMAGIFEAGLQALKGSGRYAEMEAALHRELGM